MTFLFHSLGAALLFSSFGHCISLL